MTALIRNGLFAVAVAIGGPVLLYLGSLSLLITVPSIETHAVYRHRPLFAETRNLNAPEQFGFAHGQVVPFSIVTEDDVKLHAWHILPVGLYSKHIGELQERRTGIEQTPNFRLVRDDPEARLVIYAHGATGSLASIWRPESYRALSSASPYKIHVLAFDYRGYGLSEGSPNEKGLQKDVLAAFSWATEVAQIPPLRIVIFGQSLGSGVAISLARDLARRRIDVAGLITSGGFTDVATLSATFAIPPLAKFPSVLSFFTSRLANTWENWDRLADFVRASERYHIQLIHAEDDPAVPSAHCDAFFRHAVNASVSGHMTSEEFEREKSARRMDLGEGGSVVEWHTSKGLIRQDVTRYGVHDAILSYPLIGMAAVRAFQSVDPEFSG
ncbi:Alpha/Beta hydrolase protein [Xylariaceae sp. FL1272]|nr:Alpha/Beta hydrolase protein [Xylariaceae sp. FL1272]